MAAEEPIAYYDLIDVDPPPRELSPVMRRYLFHQVWRTSVPFGLSMFAVAIAVTFLVRFPSGATAGFAGGTLVLLALATWRVLLRRTRLHAVVRDGVQTPAQIGVAQHNVAATPVPLVRVRWSKLTVTLSDGRVANMVSLDRTLEEAQPGYWIRVLVHPDHPDDVVPVCSVT